MPEEKERSAHSIFCDDLRVEANGKAILIGVYTGGMVVPKFPHTLNIVVVSEFKYSASDPVSALSFSVYKDNERVLFGKIPETDLLDSAERARDKKSVEFEMITDPTRLPPDETAEVQFVYLMQTRLKATLDGPCVLRTRFETERGIVSGGNLSIFAKDTPREENSP